MSRGSGRSLVVRVFLGIVAVTLLSVLGAGLVIRETFAGALASFLDEIRLTFPHVGQGRGSQMLLVGAEQTFLDSVDRGILLAAVASVALAAIVALWLAAYLTRPLHRLTAATRAVAEGDLTHRVDESGPAEVAQLAGSFNAMAAALAQAEELRRRLVADVAHELRNPIAALRAQAEGMAEGVLPADERRLASLVEDATHLSRLVEDLQELTAVEAGRLPYYVEEVDLCALVRREVGRVEGLARAEVSLDAVCDADARVRGDERRLGQVLHNLLVNALRHTDEGSVVAEVSELDGSAVVTVRDTGEGIAAEDVPHIFERFYRADAARARDTGGSGIGLAIARRIVRDHGGDVFAQSERGVGSRIGFTLPVGDGRLPLEDQPLSGRSEQA